MRRVVALLNLNNPSTGALPSIWLFFPTQAGSGKRECACAEDTYFLNVGLASAGRMWHLIAVTSFLSPLPFCFTLCYR